ncbi:chromosome partitioning protein [Litorivivens lipolytica]|uniref:Chromosome partitioning protein n=2 Tax=Litorivivens lipolytica TaxID=1524264 RepID=A0A7W4Z746_9GAMM|nr:chromosome partitioning protein [Litorivivens lipolytica]
MDVDESSIAGQLPPKHPDYEPGDMEICERSSVVDLWDGYAVLPHSTRVSPETGYSGRVDVLAGHPEKLEAIVSKYSINCGTTASKIIRRFREVIHSEEVASEYDIIIVDTGPSRNAVYWAALRAATYSVIPIELETKALSCLNAVLQSITADNMSRPLGAPHNNVVSLIPNRVKMNTNIHITQMKEFYETVPALMPPRWVYLPESSVYSALNMKGFASEGLHQIKEGRCNEQQAAGLVCQSVYGRIYSSGTFA